jgi:hypothetical protein
MDLDELVDAVALSPGALGRAHLRRDSIARGAPGDGDLMETYARYFAQQC